MCVTFMEFYKKKKKKNNCKENYQILEFGIQICIKNITKKNLFYVCSSLIAGLHEL